MTKVADSILIIVPAYNEEGAIGAVVAGLQEIRGDRIDLLVVNDCSTDATAAILDEVGVEHLDLPINLGLAGAVQAGLRYASRRGYGGAVQFDGDGQHLPEYLLPMKQALDAGADIVIGSRYLTGSRGFEPRALGSRLLSSLIRITTGQRLTDPTSGLRMYSEKVIHAMAGSCNHGPEPDTVAHLIRRGCQVVEIPVRMKARESGSSYLGFLNSLRYMIRMLISLAIINPLR